MAFSQRNHNPMTRKVSNLTEGNITKNIFSLALPMIISNALNIILEITDAFFVGRLGSEALAGVTTAGTIIFFLGTFGAGLGIGTVALISRAFGEKNFEKADHIAVQSLYLGVAIAIFTGLAGFSFSGSLLNFLGAKGKVLEIGSAYLKILFIGLFTMFFMFSGNAVFQGAGDTFTPMKIGAISAILNIILDPILIFGLFGFPKWEAPGAAIATVFSRTVGGLLMIFVLMRGKNVVHIKLKENILPDFEVIKKIFIVGFPGSLQMLLRSFSAVVLTKIVALFGTVVLAAYGVGGRIFHLFLFPGFGFGGASATLVGQNLGAKNPERAYKSVMLSSFYYFIFLFFTGILVFIFADSVAKFFNPEKEFVKIASIYFRYISAGSIFLCLGVVFSQSLQGAGETVLPMLLTGLTLYVIQIPLAYFLSNHFQLKETGIWIAGFVGSFSNAILMSIAFFSGRWKHKKI